MIRTDYQADNFDIYESWCRENNFSMKTQQLSPGKSRFEISSCSLRDMVIWRCSSGQSMFDQFSPLPGTVEFVFSFLNETANWCGFEAFGSTMVIYRGGQSYYARTPKNLITYGVTMPEHTLNHCGLLPSELFKLSYSPDNAIFCYPKNQTARICSHIDALLPNVVQRTEFTHFERNEIYEDTLAVLHQSISCYIGDPIEKGSAPTLSSRHQQAVFSMVNEIFEKSLTQPVKMSEIAGLVGCSRRTIEKVYFKSTGLSPSVFFKNKRLHAARSHLQQGSSVLSACHEFGFSNQGRFAAEYNMLFGEMPSQTAR